MEYIIWCVDHYSKWIELHKLDSLSTKNTICYLKSQFSKYGIPDEVLSDNGPHYARTEFEEFPTKYGFKHTTLSYPQSNGAAEHATNMLKKAQDPYKALLNYRSTLLEDVDLSPAQLMMGCRLKLILSTASWRSKMRCRDYFMTNTGRELPPLQTGDLVRMQQWQVDICESSTQTFITKVICGEDNKWQDVPKKSLTPAFESSSRDHPIKKRSWLHNNQSDSLAWYPLMQDIPRAVSNNWQHKLDRKQIHHLHSQRPLSMSESCNPPPPPPPHNICLSTPTPGGPQFLWSWSNRSTTGISSIWPTSCQMPSRTMKSPRSCCFKTSS